METATQKNTIAGAMEISYHPPAGLPSEVPVFRGEYDEQGVYVYQAYSDAIADYALEHQNFGGPDWKPTRMTWIKPSFAWMLYRSGYGMKPGQRRVLKIKLSHKAIAHLLSECKLTNTNKDTKLKATKSDKGSGRVQWDPERDLYESEKEEPRKMLRTRAIQIGLSGTLSEWYVENIISIEEVTNLAHRVKAVHSLKTENDVASAMECLRCELPIEEPYLPLLSEEHLQNLAMLPGPVCESVVRIGRGHAATAEKVEAAVI